MILQGFQMNYEDKQITKFVYHKFLWDFLPKLTPGLAGKNLQYFSA